MKTARHPVPHLLIALVAAAASSSSLTGSGAARPSEKLGAVVGPVTLVPEGSAPVAIGGLHAYYGAIELNPFADGLTVVDELSLEKYLLGLQEVPLDWHEEALRAQAVAARTYALWTLGRPRAGSAAAYGFDICASVQCQVFAGADVALSSFGDRWVDAVESTAGEAILYKGAPILARYHSTSGGRTLTNSQGFPAERDYPYLRSVPSPTERASPLYRWHVRFSLRRLQLILERAGQWTHRNGRLVDVRTDPSVYNDPDVAFTGTKAGVVIGAEELRELVGRYAPVLYPERYPSAAPTASGRLPETFPSERISVETRSGIVRVTGHGWGHGVGMSQWGANGLAGKGASYVDILEHYYTGTSVGPVEASTNIEVGVAVAQRSIRASGSFRVVDGRGKTIVRHALGTWDFGWAGSGAVAIDPPQGYGLPLQVGIVKAPRVVDRGDVVRITVALSKPAKVRTVTRSGSGFEDLPRQIKDAGRRRLEWFAPQEAGTYEVTVRASTGARVRASDPIRIIVRDPLTASPRVGFQEDSDSSRTKNILLILIAAFSATALIAGLVGRIRR